MGGEYTKRIIDKYQDLVDYFILDYKIKASEIFLRKCREKILENNSIKSNEYYKNQQEYCINEIKKCQKKINKFSAKYFNENNLLLLKLYALFQSGASNYYCELWKDNSFRLLCEQIYRKYQTYIPIECNNYIASHSGKVIVDSKGKDIYLEIKDCLNRIGDMYSEDNIFKINFRKIDFYFLLNSVNYHYYISKENICDANFGFGLFDKIPLNNIKDFRFIVLISLYSRITSTPYNKLDIKFSYIDTFVEPKRNAKRNANRCIYYTDKICRYNNRRCNTSVNCTLYEEGIQLTIDNKECNSDIIDFGDDVIVFCENDNDEISIKMKSYYEQNLFNPLQKLLIHKKLGDVVSYNDFNYKILSIKKVN